MPYCCPPSALRYIWHLQNPSHHLNLFFSGGVLSLLGVACLKNLVKAVEVYGSLQIVTLAFLKAWGSWVLQAWRSHSHPQFPTFCFHVGWRPAAHGEWDFLLLVKVSGSVCLFRLRGLTGSLPSLFGGPWWEEERCFMEVTLKVVLEGQAEQMFPD